MSRIVPLSLCLSAALILVSSFSSAQEVSGSIIGTIQDASGAGVPGAKVNVTNTDRKQLVRSVISGSNGEYTATLLPIGRYTVAVEAPGFKKASKTEVELNVNDKLTINFALEVGSVSEEVTVQSSVTQVETQSAEASNLISGTQVRELALNTRNYVQLVTLMPGVTTGGNDQVYVGVSAPAGTSNQTQFSVNGARISQNNWTIDGADNVDRGANLTLLNYPSVDAIAEFKVLRGLYTAEFGRGAGGQINVVTKSGTSAFHGDAYEFVRNNAFAANNFFNNARSLNLGPDGRAQVPPIRYNNFGYTVGGPVYIPKFYNRDKNKTFFFFSQEFRRVITYSTANGTAPTAAEKQGIFPAPICVSVSAAGSCLQTGTQVTTINPVAQAYIKDIFSKLPDGTPGTNALFSALRNVFYARQELYKIDHVFSQKLAISGRYLQDTIPTIEPGGLFTGSPYPNLATTSTNAPGKSVTIHAISSLTPTWLNEAGYFYSYGAVTNITTGLDNAALSPDIKVNLPYPVTLGRVPTLSFAGGGSGVTSFGPYADFNRNHTVFDNMSKVLGRHTLKFGFTYNHYQKTENNGRDNTGAFSFTTTGKPATGTAFEQAFASFLSGYVGTFTQASVDYAPNINANQAELYLQDDFHVRPNFTVNIGVRYSLFRAPTEANNNLSNFDPSLYDPSKAPQVDPVTGLIVGNTGDPLNGLIVAGKNSPYGNKISNENYKNFAPRFGFSWDPFKDGKTAIRSGYGIYYDTPQFGFYESEAANPPLIQNITIANTRLDMPTAGSPVVSASPKTLTASPIPYRTPYLQQFSLDVQREILPNFILDVGYLGSTGTHLVGSLDINEVPPGLAAAVGVVPAGTFITGGTTPRLNYLRPYRGYGPINAIETIYTSNYNSLQVNAQKRFSGNTLFGVSYTYSKNLTTSRADTSGPPQNTYDRRADYALAPYDRAHVFSANYVVDIPFFHAQKGLVGHVLGGWELSGITQYGTGQPFTISTAAGTDPAGLGILGASAAGPRPDQICDPNAQAPHTYTTWFNTACFADVAPGQIRPGNAGRSTIRGPGYGRWDVSLIRNVKLRESMSFQLRGEAFNVFNHTNPYAINTSLGSSQFGNVTSARDPRIIQLGAKFYF